MTLLEEVEAHFDTKDLYNVLGIDRGASSDQIKKAYRKTSLKIHPDRVSEDLKEEATKKFQVLAQVHYVLSDEERRKLYDDHGIIAKEDSLDSEADWQNYWRLLFPKITVKDINGFLDKYVGSKEEEEDLIAIYKRYEGDLDKIYEAHISYDEVRTVEELNRLIKEGKIEALDKFVNEPKSKKEKRLKRAVKESKQAAKAKREAKNEDAADLTALIQKKNQNSFDSMIASLEAKYASKSASKSSSKGTKRKRTDA